MQGYYNCDMRPCIVCTDQSVIHANIKLLASSRLTYAFSIFWDNPANVNWKVFFSTIIHFFFPETSQSHFGLPGQSVKCDSYNIVRTPDKGQSGRSQLVHTQTRSIQRRLRTNVYMTSCMHAREGKNERQKPNEGDSKLSRGMNYYHHRKEREKQRQLVQRIRQYLYGSICSVSV